MDKSDFKEFTTGNLIKIPEGVWAFVPAPLPPVKFEVSWELTQHNSEADRASSELAGIARTLPNAHLLMGSFSRREAVLSSRIEGTRTTMSQLFLFEAGGSLNEDTTDVREVYNYVIALEYGLRRSKELPICNRLIKEIHSKLMNNVRGEDRTPGEFRRGQNYIASFGCKGIEDASYVPPPVAEMHGALSDLDKYMNAKSPFPPLIQQALIHYQFEAIHPFLDGNGRVGRLLLTLMLCAEGIIPYPLLYLSDYIERYKSDYYRLLLAVSKEGDWSGWVKFFLRGVAEQSRDAFQRAVKLLELRKSYRQRLEAKSSSTMPLRLLNELFYIPVISSAQVTKMLEVTTPTALKAIDKLIEEGILKEIDTGRQRNKIYSANEIREIVEK